MKINLEAIFENAQGGELTEPSREGEKVIFKTVTLRLVVYKALLANDQKASTDDLISRYLLFKKIQKTESGECEITVQEATLLQNLVGNVFFGPLYVGQAHALLEG